MEVIREKSDVPEKIEICEREIRECKQEINQVMHQMKPLEDKALNDRSTAEVEELKALRRNVEQLRRKEEQLRKEKRQLFKMQERNKEGTCVFKI